MRIDIRNIGTSRGIIIPAALLEEYHLTDHVELKPLKNGIMLSPPDVARPGWEEDAKRIALAAEEPLMPDVFNDETFDDWEWGKS